MTQRPSIPMRPEDVPQQRIHLVKSLPSRPPSFQGYCDYIDPMSKDIRPKGSPRKTTFLCTVEWAWSPAHNRINSYYLNPRGKYWLLWNYCQNFNDWDLKWRWVLYGYGPRKDVSTKEAAVYLLLDTWASETKHWDLDKYHWIDGTGFLSIGDITAIASSVWPEESDDDPEPGYT